MEEYLICRAGGEYVFTIRIESQAVHLLWVEEMKMIAHPLTIHIHTHFSLVSIHQM